MFPQLKKLNNESGIVLFIVLMVAIIIMLLSVGILTQSLNEANYAQQQIDQIVSEQLARGAFWNAYSNSFNSNVGTSSTEIQGRNYTTTVSYDPKSNQATATVNYDTYQ